MDLISSLEGKFGVRSGPSSPNKWKNLGSSVTTRRKSWEKVPILGSYLKFRGQNLGYLSFMFLEAKFGVPTRISEAKFGAWPPDLLIWKYLPGIFASCVHGTQSVFLTDLYEASQVYCTHYLQKYGDP